MTKWIGPAAWQQREARAGDRLPYAKLLDESTILLRDSGLMRTLSVPGVAFETEETEQLDHLLGVREVLLRSVLDARFVVYHHVVRRRVEVSLPDLSEPPFARELGRRWSQALSARRMFVNDQYLTIVRRPARGKAGLAERLTRRLARAEGEVDTVGLRELDTAVTALVAGLAGYGARILGGYDGLGGRCSEPLEFLSAIYNGEMRPVLAPEGVDSGHYIPYARVSFGLDAIETRRAGERDFAGILSVKEYPDTTRAGLIDGLLRLPQELVLTESFAPADRQIARERIDLAIRRLKSADAEAAAERTEMMNARDGLGAGRIGFGDHHLSVLVREGTLDRLERALASTGATLADCGAVAVREDVAMEPSFWGQFPGNEVYVARRAMISTANAAGFLSLHGFPIGKPSNNHWGEAVTVLETTSATPYFFNFHQADLGNFTVIGPSGSGKTVALNFFAAQAQRFGPRLVFFDKDRGAEIFLRALGGHYSRLSPGEPTAMNPLALPDTPANQAFLRDWLAVLLQASGPEEQAAIADAVAACYDHDPAFRRLRHFRELLGGACRPKAGDLASRLAPWVADGERAWLFDNPVDALELSARTIGFDMTALLDTPMLRTPAMMYLFHRIDERLDGEPTMILIDEGWKALDDAVFAQRIRDWLKTLRKRNALVGFATQSARDALSSSIATAIVEQTATMIFMPNAKARAEDYCDGFGLTTHELDLVRALPAESRCFLIRHANHSVVARLDLSGTGEMLMVLSGREATVRRLDTIRAVVGDDPANWYPELTGAAWPGADGETWYAEAAE